MNNKIVLKILLQQKFVCLQYNIMVIYRRNNVRATEENAKIALRKEELCPS